MENEGIRKMNIENISNRVEMIETAQGNFFGLLVSTYHAKLTTSGLREEGSIYLKLSDASGEITYSFVTVMTQYKNGDELFSDLVDIDTTRTLAGLLAADPDHLIRAQAANVTSAIHAAAQNAEIYIDRIDALNASVAIAV